MEQIDVPWLGREDPNLEMMLVQDPLGVVHCYQNMGGPVGLQSEHDEYYVTHCNRIFYGTDDSPEWRACRPDDVITCIACLYAQAAVGT